MGRKVLVLILLAVFAFALSGCASMRKNNDLEIQGLRNQVAALETELNAKNEELNGLRESSVKPAEMQAPKNVKEAKRHPKAKEIQEALKNAGYYSGKIDGKMGKQTVEAVKSFQKANNLPADGKVGRKTWALLNDHLQKK